MPDQPRRRRIWVDISPLRESRQFRLLFSGQVVSFVGTQLAVVAAPIQVFELTGSSFAVGLLGLVQLPPLLVGSLLGGSLADAHDRRRLLLVAQVLLALTSVGLAINAAVGALWPIYLLTAVAAGLSGIDSPTRSASIPGLVGAERMPAAMALNQVMYQVGLIVGPALAGVLIAWAGVGLVYWFDAGTFVVAGVAVLLMRPLRPDGEVTRAGWRSISEGLRYVRGSQPVQGVFLIDINAMVFGMPRALFPELGTVTFGGDATTVGLLFAAPGVGALAGAVTSGWTGGIRRQGLVVLAAVAAWGTAIAGFGISPWLPLALVFLAVAGAADVVSAVFRNTILHLSIPDRLRGRLSSIQIAVVTGGPRLGDVEAGTVAAFTSPRFSAFSGGMLCVAGVGVLARLLPRLTRWTLDDARRDDADQPERAREAEHD